MALYGAPLLYFSWVTGLLCWPVVGEEEQVQSISSFLFPQEHHKGGQKENHLLEGWNLPDLESHGKLGKAVSRKYLDKKPLTGPMQHSSRMKLKWKREGERKERLQFAEWYERKHKVRSMKIENREDTGAGCIGNQTEYMRGNRTQWRKCTKHSVWLGTLFTNYWKFVIFQQVFVGSVWIDWMLEINIQFLLTLVELESTFISPLQVTTTKALTDARKPFQLMLLQTVQLRFTEVDTGSQEFQFSGHENEYIFHQTKVIQGMEEVPSSTSTWDSEHWGSNLLSEFNKSWMEDNSSILRSTQVFHW